MEALTSSLFSAKKFLTKSRTAVEKSKQKQNLRKVFSISPNKLNQEQQSGTVKDLDSQNNSPERKFTRRRKKTAVVSAINPEKFEKCINFERLAKNFNFKYDADEDLSNSPTASNYQLLAQTNETLENSQNHINHVVSPHQVQEDSNKNAQVQETPYEQDFQSPQNPEKHDEIDQNEVAVPAQNEEVKSFATFDRPQDERIKSRSETRESQLEWQLIDGEDITHDMRYRDDEKLSKIPYIIFPDDPFKHFWEFIVGLNVLYTVLVLPFVVCFIDDVGTGLTVIGFCTDGIWAVDIILTFFMAYEDKDDKLVISRKKICFRYLKSWFLIDVISILPFDYIFGVQKSFNSLIRLAKFHKLMRFAKMTKLVRLLRFFKEGNKFAKYLNGLLKFTQGIDRLAVILFCFMIFCHIGACVWYLQAKLNESDATNWLNREEAVDTDSMFHIYISSLYYIIATTVTVGYGDIHAGNSIERIVAVVLMFIGAFIYSFIIGTLSSIMLARDAKDQEVESKLNTLIEMQQKFNISPYTFNKVKNSIKYGGNSRNQEGRIMFLNELPVNLRTRLSLVMYRDVLTNIDFFKHRPQRFLAHIGPYLKVLKIGKFEYICTEGEYANEMYFIRQGVVEIVLKEFNNFPFMIIEKGYFFGEIDLLFGETRKHSYRAETDCELLSINKKAFTKIFFEEFSDIGAEIYDNALKRRGRQNTSYKEAYAYCEKQAKEANKKKFEPKKTNITEGKLLNFKGKEKLRQLVKLAQDPAKKELLHKDEKHPEAEQNQETPTEKEETSQTGQIPKSQNEIPEQSDHKAETEENPPDASENPIRRKGKGWAFLKKGKDLGAIVKEVTKNNNSLESQIEVLNKKMENFEKCIKQILTTYQTLGITAEDISPQEA